MESALLQVGCVVLMFLLHFGAGVSPLLILRCCKRIDRSAGAGTSGAGPGPAVAALPAWINCFAGGVFIAMCFLGLLPYAEDKFDDADVYFPLPPAQLCVVAGIFFVLFLEAATHRWLSPREAVLDGKSNKLIVREPGDEFGGRDDRSPLMLPEDECKELRDFAVEFVAATSGEEDAQDRRALDNGGGCHSHGGVSIDDFFDGDEDGGAGGRGDASVIFLFLAINLHAFFEGMALGLQTETGKMVSLFVGILVHEIITAFALGVSVVRRRFGFAKVSKYLLSFSASIPAGIALGAVVSTAPGNGGKVASAVLQAFSAGVLLHVIFMEIIPEELGSTHAKNRRGGRFVKILYFLLGFIFLGCLSGLLHQAVG